MSTFNIAHNISLAVLSTFHIGNSASQYVLATSTEQLLSILSYIENSKIPFKIFAGGSNIVFPDEELKEFLVQFLGGKIQILDSFRVKAEAGVILADVIDLAIKNGFAGIESLSGIPGTVGGAVVGNAGAYGHSISEVVERVTVWDKGKIKTLTKKTCQFDYRESIFKKKQFVLLQIFLKFKNGDSKYLFQKSQEIINLRQAKYKPQLKCPGSFFKNVLVSNLSSASLKLIDQAKIIDGKVPAGYLLDSIGARGTKIGAIQIANFHGNLFVNIGGGTAKDVKMLASILKDRIYEKFGIRLEEEIRYF